MKTEEMHSISANAISANLDDIPLL